MLPDVFSEAGESFGVAIRAAFIEVSRPGFDFPRSARRLGVFQDPGKDFAVAFAGSQLLEQGVGIESEKADEGMVGRGVVVVLAVLLGELGASLVEHPGKDGETAEAGMGAARRALGQVSVGYLSAYIFRWVEVKERLCRR